MSRMPFMFLLCSERSGSNLITRLMGSHPEICAPFPKHLINPVARNLFRYGNLNDAQHWIVLLNDIERLLAVPFTHWHATFSTQELRQFSKPGQVGRLIRAIFEHEAKLAGKHKLFIKENHVYQFMSFLIMEFPDARYLYLVRDPRDMALSWKNSPIHSGGIVRAARQWRLDQVETLKHYWLLKQSHQAIFIRYEDLIGDIDSSLRKLSSFFRIDYHPAMLDFHLDELSLKNVDGMPAWENLVRAVQPDNKDKFLEGLTSLETAIIEKICGPEMRILGYVPVTPLETLSEIDEATIEQFAELSAQDHVAEAPARILQNMEAKKAFYQHAEPLD